MNSSFSKKDTAAIKGIAILIMMLHHCFMQEKRFEGFTISFYPFSQDFIVQISQAGKCCVGIFLFLSAYGMTCSFLKLNEQLEFTSLDAIKLTIKRYINLISGFLIAYVFCFIGSWIFTPTPLKFYKSWKTFPLYMLLDMFGLANLLDTPSLVGTWWYMGLAIVLIVLFPLLLKIYKQIGVLLVPAIICVFRLLNLEVGDYSRWMLLASVGIFFAQKDFFGKLKKWCVCKNNKVLDCCIRFFIVSCLLVLSICLSCWNYGKLNYMTMIFDLFITLMVVIWNYLFFINLPIIKEILQYFGKHSMNIFLVHTFIRTRWFYSYTYSFSHFMLIIIMLLLESLLISIVLEAVKKYSGYNRLVKKVEGIVLEKIG